MTTSSITVKHVLSTKGSGIFCVTPETSVLDALALMAEHDIGAVLVTQGDALKGIFTERDYARKLVLKGLASKSTPVGEMMTSQVETVTPETSLAHVMTTMTNRRFRHLPVVNEAGQLAGIITIGDVVKAVIEAQQATIQQLSSYISGELTT